MTVGLSNPEAAGAAASAESTGAVDSNICVQLKGVSKRYGDVQAVRSMDLSIEQGSFVTLLGPSGCGKTTTLRMVAGLESVTDGDIFIKGRRVNDVPIHRRNLGLVFQNYALFPHKSVFDNVAFGLKYRGVSRAERARRVREALGIVRLPQMENRFPAELSGGQQQRIALARAIVIEPDVLLLDEPLSALDANLREDMRVELKRIQRELGVTTIFVTHDQGEALAMSDQIVVMSNGVMEQVGSPEEVYNEPVSRFVAEFLGHANILQGRLKSAGGASEPAQVDVETGGVMQVRPARRGGPGVHDGVTVVVRAEKVKVAESHEPASGVNVLDGRITAVDYQGPFVRYFVAIGDYRLQAINTIEGRPFDEGTPVRVAIAADDCLLLR